MRPEHRLQTAGILWLRRWVPPPGLIWSGEYPRNHAAMTGDSEKAMIAGVILKGRGIYKGIHDTFILRLKDFWTIEWKYGSNRADDTQKDFAVEIAKNGGYSRACWSVVDACDFLTPFFGLGQAAAIHAMDLDAKWQAKISNIRQAPGAKAKSRALDFTKTSLKKRSLLNEPIPDLTGTIAKLPPARRPS